MKALIASLTALGLIAAPAVAQTNNTAAPAKPTHASKTVSKEAKAEGESVATEAKEHKAAAHHAKHHAKCSCPATSHKHKSAHKAAKKSTKKTTTETSTKTSG
jgi:hypothetical protein